MLTRDFFFRFFFKIIFLKNSKLQKNTRIESNFFNIDLGAFLSGNTNNNTHRPIYIYICGFEHDVSRVALDLSSYEFDKD